MTNLQTLEKKVNKLEERISRLENQAASTSSDQDLIAALYSKAKELVIKHNKASVIFLQRKLLIDFARASRLLDELQANGVIGPAVGIESRKILVKK